RVGVANCEPSVTVEQLEVGISAQNTQVAIGECGLYDDLVNTLYGWFENTIIDRAKDGLATAVTELAPEMAETALNTIANEGVEALGLRVFVAPETIAVGSEEIRVTLGSGIEALTPPERCSPGGGPITPRSLFPPSPSPLGGASFAVSRDFANHLIDVAWRQGWLCLDTRDLELDLSSGLNDIAPGLEVSAVVSTPIRPSVDFTETQVAIQLPSLQVQLGIELPNTAPSVMTVEGSASIGASIILDPVDRSVRLIPTELNAGRLDVLTVSGPLSLDPDGLRGLVDTVLMPAFKDQLEPLTVAGGVFSASGFAVSLVDLTSDQESISLAVDLFAGAANDRTPPETILESPMPTTAPATLAFTMASLDESPPERQLSHRLTIDGVREAEPRNGRNLVVSGLTSGTHVIEIAAVDLAGNEDPTPVFATFDVDADPPQIDLVQAPRGAVREERIEIVHVVRDNQTATANIRVDYTIGEVARANVEDLVVGQGSLAAGEPLILENLMEDRGYRVTLTAIDEAGNESKLDFAFAIDRTPTLDCSNTGGSLLWATFLCVGMLFFGRRRRGLAWLVACGLLLAATPAFAISDGGAFAGPTLESGTSVTWNAASLTQNRGGTRLYFEAGGSLIDIGYTRAGTDPNDGTSFEPVSFATIKPSVSFMLSTPSSLPWLDFLVGGYTPTSTGAGWPVDGPQRFFGTEQTLFTYALPVGVLISTSPRWGFSLMAGPSYGFIDTRTAFDFGA
ncbi:MAG: hypothetical protein AAF658_10090, partial [Myxococcota bacterium]